MNFHGIGNTKLKELATIYVDTSISDDSLWNAYGKDFLFELFKADDRDYIFDFSEIVNNILKNKTDNAKAECKNALSGGKFLIFDPTSTMYDGVAEIESTGFFDSTDLPPPEFWIGFFDRVLISFIPERYVEIAARGVDSCISGSLNWFEV